eukprot:g19629.t1
MVSAFDVELPFPVRDIRRRRLSINEVSTYRDIALTRGHAGKGLRKAKKAFRMGGVEAARLVDIMRQVDVSAAGSLGRHDFLLALGRAGVELAARDKDALFRSLSSARTAGIGCDIEMFACLVNFWVGDGDTTPVAMAAGRRERERASDHIFPGTSSEQLEHDQAPLDGENGSFADGGGDGGGNGGGIDARNYPSSTVADLRSYAAGEEEGDADSNHRLGNRVENTGLENSKSIRQQQQRSADAFPGRIEPAAAAAGKQNSSPVNMGDIINMNHVGTKDARAYATTADRSLGGMPEEYAHNGRGDDGEDVVEHDRSPAARALARDSEMARCGGVGRGEEEAPDQAYIHSLAYGNLGSILPILLDRRSALETSLDRLDQGGTGRVRAGDFMAAVRQVGIALSPVQEANMMDLLHRMGAVSAGADQCQWINASVALAAVSLAGEKAGGRCFQDKPRSPQKDGTRLLDALSDHYEGVHVSLLPSSILLGPNALEERRSAPDDGAGDVFVTAGSLRNALRKAGVLLGDADERVLWRLLLGRAQEVLGRTGSANGDDPHANRNTMAARQEETAAVAATSLLSRGMIPLPLLDQVMGFDAEEALRVRRQLQQQEAHPPPSVSAAYRDHLGPWAGLGSSSINGKSNSKGEADDRDEAPLLLQKARLRVKGLGATMAEREQAVLRCLPKLGPKGEQQRLPRLDLTRLLQQLRVGVRSGELQNLWYHMDRNKITRHGFRRILLEATDSLPVTFPASPCPYPAGPIGPASEISYTGDTTPVGGVSVTGARLQRVLNRAAYEDNVRRGVAGNAMTRALQRAEEGEGESRRGGGSVVGSSSSSPHPPGNEAGDRAGDPDDHLPVLLRKAISRVKELENGEEVVAALVPDMGCVRESMRITRGGIHRVLHGLGKLSDGSVRVSFLIRENCSNCGGSWIGERLVTRGYLSKISVPCFRGGGAAGLGRTSKVVLLTDWNVLGDTFSDSNGYSRHDGQEVGASVSVASGDGDGRDSPVSTALREVRTSLGLVRRRVRGIVRGCEDRDLAGGGSVTEEAFLAVLKDQGILQQLGDYGRSALRSAVVVNSTRGRGDGDDGAGLSMVRYTGLVGAIDAYLEAVMSWDKSETARRFGIANPDDGNGVGGSTISDNASARVKSTHPSIDASSEKEEQRQQGHAFEDRVRFSPQQQLPVRSAKKTIRVGVDSPNSVARAARGWDNDVPIVAPGMRHYPQRTSNMAAIVGNGGFDGRAVAPTASTPSPRHPMSLARTTPRSANSGGGGGTMMSASAGNQAEAHGGERGKPIYDVHGAGPASPSDKHQSRCARVDFVPAGGRSGLDKPEGSSGRRGSMGKSLALAGGGVSRSLVDAASSLAEGDFSGETPAPSRGGSGTVLRGATSPGTSEIFDGKGGGDSSSARLSRRRQSNTGQLRELVEAWPEDVSPAGERRRGSFDSNGSDCSVVDGDASPGRHTSPGARGSLKGGFERRRNAAKALLSDRALLAGVYRQLAGIGSQQARDGLDRTSLVKLFRYARMPVDLDQQEAEDLADAVLHNCGAPTARFASLTTFLAKTASSNTPARASVPPTPFMGHGTRNGLEDVDGDDVDHVGASRRTIDDPVAQSIRHHIMQGRSELRLAGGNEDSRLSCAVHLRRAFRKRRKNLGGDPGIVDDCSVAASDLNGVLQDLGVILNPTQTAFLIQKCRARRAVGRRPSAGGKDESPVRAGDLLACFRELLSDR